MLFALGGITDEGFKHITRRRMTGKRASTMTYDPPVQVRDAAQVHPEPIEASGQPAASSDETPTTASDGRSTAPTDSSSTSGDDEVIRLNKRTVQAMKPSIDLKDFPKKLTSADAGERTRLLQGLHERFWHAPPADMLKLLQAMLLPRDIVAQGVEVSRLCSHCRKFFPTMH